MASKRNTLHSKRIASRGLSDLPRPIRNGCPVCGARSGQPCHDHGVRREQPHHGRGARR